MKLTATPPAGGPIDSPRQRLRDSLQQDHQVGPILFCRGCFDRRLHLAALLACPAGATAPRLTAAGEEVAGEVLHERAGYRVLRYTFSLPINAAGSYRLGDDDYPVSARLDGDLRIAYVACNGQEHDDRSRYTDERNLMWRRLNDQHDARPLHLLLHGGDQVYADEMLDVHPLLRRWGDHHLDPAPDPETLATVERELGDYVFQRYLELYSQPAMSRLLRRVPSLAIWDDHDICDGWGSRPQPELDAPIGRLVFRVAREQYLLFQMAATPDALPAVCPDTAGRSLSWSVRLPGVRIVAPDLRSERRPDRVMGESGWRGLEAMLADVTDEHVLVMSSVPALGPRLSWVEWLFSIIPHAQKYEDDLRDQWQSHTHRPEWQRLLRTLLEVHGRPGCRATVLSGEIHLATRGTLAAPPAPLHQLVSSGIAHPPPPAGYARGLGALARLGEAPLPGHPIRLHPLPGRRQIYTAQRNYLMLERRAGHWRAWWELEDDGPTEALDLV